MSIQRDIKSRRVLAIVAHADDLELMAGGTVAKMIKKGFEVYQIITTNGEKGSFSINKEALIRRRREEARASAESLGLRDIFFLNYPDGELARFPGNELGEKFVKTIRQTKPDILLTWDPYGPFEVHPDHRIVGMVATEAATFSHYPLYYPEHLQQGLQPHYVSEYLFIAKHNRDANKFVDITDFVDAKVECLLKHQTQIQQTMAETRMAFSHAGIDLAAILHQEEINPENHQQIASLAIKKLAENTGSKYGVAFAEEFRYEGFAPAKMFFPDLFRDREVEL